MNFRQKHKIEDRQQESSRVLKKYPQRIPVICEKDAKCKLQQIDKVKYLVPFDMSIGEFTYVIRKRIKLRAEDAIFLLINNKIYPSTSSSLSELYSRYKDDDGFLYITYRDENTFG